ncbi:hypothetical protein NQ314_004145 [Rhamnusium bicolor]|uniref:Uncharacterized protein n=1 Tax=Rhamnusium bicolor TaxID=1586634 RepID=A0AAV8ZKV7_9CUCU|nr:hypothetical protein NQ314_004145 [Rhamnusium bicolor]
MRILPILCLLVQMSISNASPILTEDFYSALAEECPFINDIKPKFSQQEVFKNCLNWIEINHTKNLTKDNENKVLCLMYFDSFVYFCKELLTSKMQNITLNLLIPDVKDYQVDNICKNLSLFPANKKFEFKHNISQLIANEGTCYKLCSTYANTAVTECSLAHYFTNFNVTALAQKDVAKLAQKGIVKQLPGEVDGVLKSNSTNVKTHEVETPVDAPQITTAQLVPPQEPQPRESASQRNELHEDVSDKQQNFKKAAKSVLDAGTSANVKDIQKGVDTNQLSKLKKTNDENKADLSKGAVAPNQRTETDESVGKSQGLNSQQTNLDQPEISNDNPVNNLGNTAVNSPVENLSEKNSEIPENPDLTKDDEVDKENPTNTEDEKKFPVEPEEDGKPGEVEEKKEKPNTVVMALVLEGKRGKRQYRGRRPNSANYHKLDSNLEEAISSTCTKNSSNVIY